MKGFHDVRALIRARLDEEVGTIRREAPRRIALVYPSPYHVAMSSLGFQSIYGIFNRVDGWTAERAFLPDDVEAWRRARLPLVTYELELTGLFDCLALAGVPLHAHERGPQHPLVVAGGPLTFSNPLPLGP